MRLISCHVENFGCLHEFDYIFTDGVNVICRENGWGKSTFAAFLLAMFYGLPSKGKRGQTLSAEAGFSAMNARAAYRPWQGGVFGGRLVFEAGGRIYEAARLFGERESQDEFDLRDLETNLPSFDYSPDLGKELFRVDRESFVRTVFTAQQDCRTRPTDDVNALITDLARNAGDMESYASAQKRLKEAANRLTPRRASGRIHRLEERIEELERSTAASAGIEESIALCDQKKSELDRKKSELENEQQRLEEAISAAEQNQENAADMERADQSIQAKHKIWQSLYKTNLRRSEGMQTASAFFPGRIPSRAEADLFLQSCREIERLEERMQVQMLTEEEQERLNILEDRFRHDSLPGKNMKRAEKKTGTSCEGRPETFSHDDAAHRFSRGRILPFLTGAALLLIAAGLRAAGGTSSKLPAAVSMILAAFGIAAIAAAFFAGRPGRRRKGYTDQKKKKNRDSVRMYENPAAESVPAGEEDPAAESDPAGVEDSASYEEYLYLEKKEEKLEETYAAWAQARKPVRRFLKELGFAPSKDLHSQLIRVRDAADDCEDAAALLEESAQELRAFEEEMCRNGLTEGEKQQVLRNMGDSPEEKQQKNEPDSREPYAAEISPEDAAVLLLDQWKAQEEYSRMYSGLDENDKGMLTAAAPLPEGRRSMERRNTAASDLRRRRDQVQNERMRCMTLAAEAEREREELVCEQEERDVMLEELLELRGQRETDLADYRHIMAASALLQKAKESLTARYADPIRAGFCRYWEMITGISASGVYVDANTKVTVEEKGKQRESDLLSAGWRDLTGICLRAALAEAMYPAAERERPPLILDDPFTNLDDEKIGGAMHFLEEMGKSFQILYFTCSRTRA